MTKVNNQPQLVAGCLEIIMYLGTVFIVNLLHSLNLYDDRSEADEIGNIFFP